MLAPLLLMSAETSSVIMPLLCAEGIGDGVLWVCVAVEAMVTTPQNTKAAPRK
jgi:hypothetical protein